MKKEVILVPKDKCPLDVLVELGDRVKNSWFFLHKNAYEKLLKMNIGHMKFNILNSPERMCITLKNENKESPDTVIFCDIPRPTWGQITSIDAPNIAYYGVRPFDPEDIYFLKMDE